ncbi:MAG: hypothetical protein DRI57_11565 [Deltaproteobacteria bacterium]|nr:MAG: hypothetical protein DRI57_11565 [Deltaproteobacteria bacterium]
MEIRPTLIILITVFSLMMTASAAPSADISEFRITQTSTVLPEIKVYADISDADGNPVQGIQPEQITATSGTDTVTVTDIVPFEESSEGVAYILLTDISKSLKKQQFKQIRDALNAWVEAMRAEDRASVITFGNTVKVVQDFTADKESLKSEISSLKPSDNHTQLHRGLVKAMEMGRRTDPDLPACRVIVTLSDGHDDFAGGMTQQEVLDRMREDRVPIYAIGFHNPPSTREKEAFLKTLGAFARTSGGAYYKAGRTQFSEMYAEMRKRILRVFVVKLSCDTCNADGRVYRLQMNLSVGNKSLTDGSDIRLLPAAYSPIVPTRLVPEPPAEPESWKKIPWPVYAGCGTLILILLICLLRRKKAKPEPQESEVQRGSPEQDEPRDVPVQSPEDKNAAGLVGLKLRLTKVGGDMPSEPYKVNLVDRAVIGRSTSASDVVIPGDDEISGRHCELTLEDGMVFIRDMESTNSTFVNGVPVMGKHRLENRDVILLGRTEFRVTF